MFKKITFKVHKFLIFLYKLAKVSLGIKKEENRQNLTNLIEAGFVWLIGTPILLILVPHIYNPITWTLIVLSCLILSNLSDIWDFIEGK